MPEMIEERYAEQHAESCGEAEEVRAVLHDLSATADLLTM